LKKLGFLGKILFWVNTVAALLLVICFFVPYLAPKTFATISILSVFTSPILVINFIFVIYWTLRRRRQVFLSLTLLIIAFFVFPTAMKFSTRDDASEYKNTLKVLSYNVRLFNAYEENSSINISENLSELLETQDPDVVCIQEYYKNVHLKFPKYPYQYIHYKVTDQKKGALKESILGHAILSKYPLINGAAFDFYGTYNNSIYADVIKDTDTIRVYNLHLNSLGIKSSVSSLQDNDKEKLRKRLAGAFIGQQDQLESVLTHKETSPHPVIMCGDFNNTPYSFVYNKASEGMQDAFLERGSGIGATLYFDFYPMRIDYIFSSEEFHVSDFVTIKETFSDHFPVMATFGWE
tara:strand:+ start:148982 stop:150031 length:1050 start_codon:yes stop_codon:yes gene_type:complete